MSTTDSKLLDSVKFILQNIEISGFKAEFDLNTKQVRVELLAEFDDMDKGLKGLKQLSGSSNKNAVDVNPEKTRDPPENDNKKGDPEDPRQTNISKKIGKFLTSGITQTEGSMLDSNKIEIERPRRSRKENTAS